MAEDIKIKEDDTGKKKKKVKIFKNNTIINSQSWTTSQKKKLMSLLYEYPLDAYKSMASKIRGKDEKQVKEFIEKLKVQVKSRHIWKTVSNKDMKKAPLEEWLEVATDMVEFENVDNSTNLTKVLSVISHFEDFKMPPADDDDDVDGPNYKSIYKYLSQVLQADRHDDLETLGPIESAIVLDMLHGLMEVLSDFDTVVQRNIIKWKYQLMNAHDQNGQSYPELLKRASENDFTEFIEESRMLKNKDKEHEKRYVARMKRMAGVEMSEESKKSVGATKRKRKEQASTKSSKSSKNEASSSSYTTTKLDIDKQTENEADAGIIVETSENGKPVIKRHKPGRKGALDPPEVPYTEIVLVMPPKGVEIVNYNPRTKKGAKDRTDGKYQSLDPDEELVHNDYSREITYDVHRTELNQFMKVEPKQEKVADTTDIEDKYDSVMKTEKERENDIPIKKPKLYSINPFCLPVTLLDLKRLHRS